MNTAYNGNVSKQQLFEIDCIVYTCKSKEAYLNFYWLIEQINGSYWLNTNHITVGFYGFNQEKNQYNLINYYHNLLHAKIEFCIVQ